MKTTKLFASIFALGMATQTHAANIIFSDNFEGVTPPAAPSSTKWQTTGGYSTGNDATSFDTTTTYAKANGAGNQLFSQNIALSGILTMTSFDFNDQTAAGAALPGIRFGLKTAGGGDFNTDASSAFQVIFSQGTVTTGFSTSVSSTPTAAVTYTPGVATSISFAFNDSDSATNYTGADGVSRSLGTNQASLYIGNSWVGIYNGGASAPGTFAFRQFNANADGRYFIDNVSVEAIPEPSIMLLGGFGLLIAVGRRSRKS